MGIPLFEHYSRTLDTYGDKALQPFKVKMSSLRLFKELSEYFNHNNYKPIIEKPDFNELYAVKGKYEVTIHMVPDGQVIRIVVAVYTEKLFGNPRSKVREINQELQGLFANSIV